MQASVAAKKLTAAKKPAAARKPTAAKRLTAAKKLSEREGAPTVAGPAACERARRRLRRAPPERGSRPAPDDGLRSARGVSRAGRVARPPALGGLQGPRRHRRRGVRGRVRRRADHRRAAPRQPRPGRSRARGHRGGGRRAPQLRTRSRPSPAACARSTSSSAPACGTPRPSASGCTRSPPSTPPTASPTEVGLRESRPPDRHEPAARRRQAGAAARLPRLPLPGPPRRADARGAHPPGAARARRRPRAGRRRARSAAGGCPATLATPIERHHNPDVEGEAAFIRLADMLAHYEQGARVSPTEMLQTARSVGLGPEELQAGDVRTAEPHQPAPAPRRPVPAVRARAAASCSGWPRARSTSRSPTS